MINMCAMALLAVAGLGLEFGIVQPATAFTMQPTIKMHSVIEDVACRVVRSRIVLPGGRVVYRSVRTCSTPVVRPVPHCKVARERIVRPNGTIVFRSVRRCG